MLDAAKVTSISILGADYPRDVRCHGFFHVFQGITPCAIFALDGRPILQIAVERWEFNSDRIRIKHRRGVRDGCKNYVAVHAQGKLRFRAAYPGGRALFDPTWDVIDEETSDWWLWLSRVVTPRMDTIIKLWEAGI